ncbi:hypothetical protein MTO96_031028 [Rhipicephalus appendiculatus]
MPEATFVPALRGKFPETPGRNKPHTHVRFRGHGSARCSIRVVVITRAAGGEGCSTVVYEPGGSERGGACCAVSPATFSESPS